MAKLMEHQGKAIFDRFGIPIPKGQVVHTVAEAQAAARDIGYPVAVKAQVQSGKRGKAGGVRMAKDDGELAAAAGEILAARFYGLAPEALLIEQQAGVQREIYVGITADPSLRAPAVIVSMEGGIAIEEVAERNPDALHKLPVDMLRGVQTYHALNLLRHVDDLTSKQKMALARVICGLYQVYRRYDCKLVEINPLALTEDGIVALDARVDVDDDSLGRHADLHIEMAEEAGARGSTALERVGGTIDAHDHRGTVHFVQIDPDLSYVREKGKVPFGFDCVGAGASLTMMDELVPLGFYPVNFCDSSGNPVGSKLYRITKVIFSQPGIEGYVFVSCISSQQLDNTARGIIKALKELYPQTGGQPSIPTVLAFRGAWDTDAIQLLADHGISAGRWVRVLGREADERSAAETFLVLHKEWRAAKGDAS